MLRYVNFDCGWVEESCCFTARMLLFNRVYCKTEENSLMITFIDLRVLINIRRWMITTLVRELAVRDRNVRIISGEKKLTWIIQIEKQDQYETLEKASYIRVFLLLSVIWNELWKCFWLNLGSLRSRRWNFSYSEYRVKRSGLNGENLRDFKGCHEGTD